MQIDLAFSCVQFSRSLVLTGLDTSPSLYIGFSENRVGNFLFINMFRIFSIHGNFGPLFGPTSIQYSQGDLLSSYCGVLGLFWEATLWTSKSQQTCHVFAGLGHVAANSPSVAMERPWMSPCMYIHVSDLLDAWSMFFLLITILVDWKKCLWIRKETWTYWIYRN